MGRQFLESATDEVERVDLEESLRVYRAVDRHGIGKILNYVHDRPYELSSLHIDDQGVFGLVVSVRTVRQKRFLGFSHRKFGCAPALLRILGASSFEVFDRANIGEGDICDIEVSEGEIRLLGSLPVDVRVKVSNPEIELILPKDAFLA